MWQFHVSHAWDGSISFKDHTSMMRKLQLLSHSSTRIPFSDIFPQFHPRPYWCRSFLGQYSILLLALPVIPSTPGAYQIWRMFPVTLNKQQLCWDVFLNPWPWAAHMARSKSKLIIGLAWEPLSITARASYFSFAGSETLCFQPLILAFCVASNHSYIQLGEVEASSFISFLLHLRCPRIYFPETISSSRDGLSPITFCCTCRFLQIKSALCAVCLWLPPTWAAARREDLDHFTSPGFPFIPLPSRIPHLDHIIHMYYYYLIPLSQSVGSFCIVLVKPKVPVSSDGTVLDPSFPRFSSHPVHLHGMGWLFFFGSWMAGLQGRCMILFGL